MVPFEYDPEAAFEKAFVRLRQAAVPQHESFLALRAAAGVLQVVAAGIAMLALLGVVGLLRSNEPRFLDVSKGYLVIALVLGAVLVDLTLLVLADVLTLQVAVARNTRIMSLVMAEMNLAQASHAEAEFLAGRFPSVPAPSVPAPSVPAPSAPPDSRMGDTTG